MSSVAPWSLKPALVRSCPPRRHAAVIAFAYGQLVAPTICWTLFAPQRFYLPRTSGLHWPTPQRLLCFVLVRSQIQAGTCVFVKNQPVSGVLKRGDAESAEEMRERKLCDLSASAVLFLQGEMALEGSLLLGDGVNEFEAFG